MFTLPPLAGRVLRAAALVAVLPTAACYHQVVETGRTASPQVIEKPWQMSFIYGLVPPPVVQTAAQCPGGVAKVETQHSFLNGLVASLTFGLVTPMHVTVTCAQGGSASSAAADAVRAGDSDEERAAAINDAAARSRESGQGVLVQF